MTPPPFDLSRLLEQREFLRRLARSLVGDAHRAEDLVQDACLLALERPPKSGALRPWLSGVVRRLALKSLAREAERPAREARAARPELDVEQEARDLELSGQLVQALRSLDAPYRSVLWLRYYRGLTPSEIARERELPLATVKTRLRRGLERLRQTLDAEFGERERWSRALLPLAGLPALPTTALVPAATSATLPLSAVLVMNKSLVALGLAGVLLAVASLVMWIEPSGSSTETQVGVQEPTSAPEPEDALTELEGVASGREQSGRERPQSAPDRVAQLTERDTAEGASPNTFGGRVVDARGRGVGGARVLVRRVERSWLRGEAIAADGGFQAPANERELESASDGGFETPALGAGEYRLLVEAPGFAPYERTLTADERAGDLGDLVLDEGVLLSGRVLDADGQAVEGVAVVRPESDLAPGLRVIGERPTGELVATTDAFGEFHVQVQAVGPWRLLFVHADHPDGVAEGQTERPGQHLRDLDVVLARGASIAGSLIGLPPDASEALYVRASPAEADDLNSMRALDAMGRTGSEVRMAPIEAGGRFELRGLEPGESYQLRAWSRPEGDPWTGGGDRSRSRVALAEAGERDVQLTWASGATLRFQVVDADSGEPVERFAYEIGPNDLMGTWDASPQITRHRDGRVEVGEVRPRDESNRARVTVRAPGYHPLNQGDLDFVPEQDNDLGVLRLRPSERLYVTVLEASTRRPVERAQVRLREIVEPDDPSGTTVRTFRIGASSDSSSPAPRRTDEAATRTDAEGRAYVSSMAGKRAELRVEAPGFAPHTETLELPEGRDLDWEVLLVPGLEAVVLVVDSAGEPLEGVRVEHRESQDEGGALVLGGPPRGTASDSEGRAVFRDLAPGLHHFRLNERNQSGLPGMSMSIAIAGMDGPEEEPWSELLVEQGETPSLTLVASPRATVRGFVSQGGDALSGAEVSLLTEQERNSPLFLGASLRSTTDSQGRFQFDEVVVGEYQLRVTHRGRAMAHEEDLELVEGENELELELPVTVVRGRVLDEDGEPVVGSSVSASAAGGEGGGTRVGMVMMRSSAGDSQTIVGGGTGELGSATTDEEGRYELFGLRTRTPVRISVRGPGHAPERSETFELARNEVRELDVRVRPAGSVRVEVVRADGSPMGSGLINASYLDEADEEVEPQSTLLTPSGLATLPGLRPGRWEVRLQVFDPANPGPPQSPLEPRVVEVVGGEEESVRFELP